MCYMKLYAFHDTVFVLIKCSTLKNSICENGKLSYILNGDFIDVNVYALLESVLYKVFLRLTKGILYVYHCQ